MAFPQLASVPPPPGQQLGGPATVGSLGGFLSVVSAGALDEQDRKEAQRTQAMPVVSGLASHIRSRWMSAQQAKQDIEQRMLKALRQRRGQYDPDKLAEIRKSGGSEVYMMLTSVKCRAASSWIRDVVMAGGSEKPWTLTPTPVPSLRPDFVQTAVAKVTADIVQAYGAGIVPTDDDIKQQLLTRKEEVFRAVMDAATETSQHMERYIEDQFDEGGFRDAFSAFIDDLCTFPAAILKGPVTRNVKKSKWAQDATGAWVVKVEDELSPQFERVDPFYIYPMALAENVNDSDLIERHKLTRSGLVQLKGMGEDGGYDDASIDLVLDQYGRGGLHEWLSNDSAKADAEGKTNVVSVGSDETIDALEFWGTVQGKLLIEWGMDKKEVPDELAEYAVNAWLIGSYVIKATLNYDPLGRKPYYKASFEEIPGLFWGNGVPDLLTDTQDVCNAAARALVNNMGIASGPQCEVNIDRLPSGEKITNMYPWKIWQTTESPNGASGGAMSWFQPNSNAAELMGIFDKFSILADEYSGIPRYMTGDVSVGGVGRTASGMSMMMSNASKSIKQVISTIDVKVLSPLLNTLYDYNMKYGPDEVKGDCQIVARGALSLVTKETAAQRRAEFLQATMNPFDTQIMGMEGRAALLRENAKALDINVDKIIPSPEAVKQKEQAMAAMQAQMAAQGQQPGAGSGGTPPGMRPMSGSGQTLQDGRPITDLATPQPQ